jgi:hypothetical protein
MGVAADEAIAYIEVQDPKTQKPRDTFHGRTTTRSQAVTYGPKFSRQIEELSQDESENLSEGTVLDGKAAFNYLTRRLSLARSRGADIDGG